MWHTSFGRGCWHGMRSGFTWSPISSRPASSYPASRRCSLARQQRRAGAEATRRATLQRPCLPLRLRDTFSRTEGRPCPLKRLCWSAACCLPTKMSWLRLRGCGSNGFLSRNSSRAGMSFTSCSSRGSLLPAGTLTCGGGSVFLATAMKTRLTKSNYEFKVPYQTWMACCRLIKRHIDVHVPVVCRNFDIN